MSTGSYMDLYRPEQWAPYDRDYREWLWSQIARTTDEIQRLSPVAFAEAHRYLPQSVTRYSGYISFDLTPYWIEILNCFSPDEPVREVSVMKGVQVAYTTALETLIFYLAGHIKTAPGMYATADLDLASARMDLNIIPMFEHSGMEDIFVSPSAVNSKTKGITKARLAWQGGGYLVPFGANSANKMRQFTIWMMLMDEIDGWARFLAGGGDPVRLFKDRCAAMWEIRKIFMGSTPLYKNASHIQTQFERGDQRKYHVKCLNPDCRHPQELRWNGVHKDTGRPFGFAWDLTADKQLILDSVRYECAECGHRHYEHHKPKLFSLDNAEWVPTAIPVEPGIRSYHLSALYSPLGMQPWSKSAAAWREAWDDENNQVRDVAALMVFYNNVLGRPFEHLGSQVTISEASSHRRTEYRKGEIPNTYIAEHCPSEVLLLTCTIDVHKSNIAVAIWGWTRDMVCWLIDYYRIRDDSDAGCGNPDSAVWSQVRELVEDKVWEADNGKKYRLAMTLIDSGWAPSTVTAFCGDYASGVYAIVGRTQVSRTQNVKEFAEFKTVSGNVGFRIHVNHYKERLSSVLRRQWVPESGRQRPYTFNAPVDIQNFELLELTREQRKEQVDNLGVVKYVWDRPHGSDNELWDLVVYGNASVEILAWLLCVRHLGEEQVDWEAFWTLLEEQQLYVG